ncbi:MAG: quaternary ammonium transporter [Actinobacteria bacterium]|nr:quaternary ammonium transporter [Actinomycetota bacterium]
MGTITVGSKNSTEEFIVGEMYALMLENAGFTVNRKFNLDGTQAAQAAIVSGQIDLYPEYTGAALVTVLKLPFDRDADRDFQTVSNRVFRTVSEAYKQQFSLTWLDQSPMNGTQALAMTQNGSSKYDIKSISGMVSQASNLTMVGPPEFESKDDGLPGLKAVYGNFSLKRYIPAGPGPAYQDLLNGDAQVVVTFGTDGKIAANNLVVLDDDRNVFPPYHIAPVVRQDTLGNNPDIAGVLNRLAPLLTTEVARRLNNEVDGKHREPAEVAREFLLQHELIGD